MAEGRVLVCSNCARDVQVWDEGNPYYRDAEGRKHYAYHPNLEREFCTGIDVSMLCLNCGEESMVDEEAPPSPCRECKTGTLVELHELDGLTCPYCKQGTFAFDPTSIIIS